jgi:hypothetical protein
MEDVLGHLKDLIVGAVGPVTRALRENQLDSRASVSRTGPGESLGKR